MARDRAFALKVIIAWTFAILVSFESAATAQTCGLCGDVNGDGQVDIVDALFLAQHTVGLRATLPCAAQADVRDTDSTDIVDAMFIAQHSVGARPILCFQIQSPQPFALASGATAAIGGAITARGSAAVQCNGVEASAANGAFAADVPLREGNTRVVCVAQAEGNEVATDARTVTRDSEPPRLLIRSPGDGESTTATAISVAGSAEDLVLGVVAGEQAQVSCNGLEAQVANRTFVVPSLALALGANLIECTARDRAGNSSSAVIALTRLAPTLPAIEKVSGDLQTGTINSPLPENLVVALRDAAGEPAVNRTVIFKVIENDGSLDSEDMQGRSIVSSTDAGGLARVQWTLGTRSGAGNHRVVAKATGFAGEVLFTASATSGPPSAILVDTGNNQHGGVAEELSRPFVAVVIDAGNNRLRDVPVTFSVLAGGGSFAGQPMMTTASDGDGRAQAILTLGSPVGVDNNRVQATFPGNPGVPAIFVASGEEPGDPAMTTVSGFVLDNTDAPVPGALVMIRDTALSTSTDENGYFRITGTPVGHVFLLVDGAAVTRPGTWPTLEIEMVLVAGRDNQLGRGPLHMLPLELPGGDGTENKLCVDDTHGGTITIPDIPGLSLTIAPGSATFLDGTHSGCVRVTQVHPDKAPMPPPFGQQPRLLLTVQPSGTRFDPPAAISMPNSGALAPGRKLEIYSFDHDLGEFVVIGTGTVSQDGSVIESDPGVGVSKAGWLIDQNPPPQGIVDRTCNDYNPCTLDSNSTSGMCAHTALPDNTACPTVDYIFNFTTAADPTVKIPVKIGNSCFGVCMSGQCVEDGMHTPYNMAALAHAIEDVFRKIFESDCVGEPLRKTLRCNLAGCPQAECGTIPGCDNPALTTGGIVVQCDPRVDIGGQTSQRGNFVTIAAGAFLPTTLLEATVLHELVHGRGRNRGGPMHNNPNVYDPTDKPNGCEVACYPRSCPASCPPGCAPGCLNLCPPGCPLPGDPMACT